MSTELTESTLPLDEARSLHERILKGYKHKGATDMAIRHLLYAYNRGNGWAAMGYKNLWTAFEGRLKHEYDIGASMMYKLIKQGVAEDQVGILPKAIGGESTGTRSRKHVQNLSGRALTQLAKLNDQPENQKKAFEKARLRAGNNPINETIVKAAIKPFVTTPEEKPARLHLSGDHKGKVIAWVFNAHEEAVKMKAPARAVEHLALALKLLQIWKEA